jgi:uncharacterized protein (UPF0335 family)
MSSKTQQKKKRPPWRQPDGSLVSCVEKIKVLEENLEEIQVMCQDALEDALVMGCDSDQFRSVLHDIVNSLENSIKDS